MAATGAASIIITDTDSGARARVSYSFHGHDDTQAPPNIQIPAAADPRLARAAQHGKTLFGALPEQTRLALLREATPEELWHAPGIEWDQVPAIVAGAVLYTPNWPNRWAALLAAAVLARNGLSRGSIRTASASFKRLALHLHQRFGTNCWTEVTPTQWRDVAQDEQLSTATRATWFEWYQAVSSFHVQEYFEGLSAENQAALTAYAWPRLPARFVDRHVPTRAADNEAQRRRKARTDVLVPITHIITALVIRRKAAAQRLVEHFRAAVADVEAGRQQLPVTIEYADVIPDVNRDAVRVDDVRWVDRPVQLRFTLWTPRVWTFSRQDVAKTYLRKLRRPTASRTDAAFRSGEYFLQFEGRLCRKVRHHYAASADGLLRVCLGCAAGLPLGQLTAADAAAELIAQRRTVHRRDFVQRLRARFPELPWDTGIVREGRQRRHVRHTASDTVAGAVVNTPNQA